MLQLSVWFSFNKHMGMHFYLCGAFNTLLKGRHRGYGTAELSIGIRQGASTFSTEDTYKRREMVQR